MRGPAAMVPPGMARAVSAALVALAVGGGLGVLATSEGPVSGIALAPMAALGVLAVGLAVTAPRMLVILALPGCLLMTRVGGVLSISDVVLAGATVLSFLLVRGRDMFPMRTLLWAGIAYLAAALPTVVLNPFAANAVESVHEVVLVLGSMVVGFAIGRTGLAQRAAGLFAGTSAVLAAVTFVVGCLMFVRGEGFGPVYLPDFHKNLIGGSLAIALVLLYARPAWFRWRPTTAWIAMGVIALGIAASGARQGMIGAAVGLLVVALRPHPDSGRLRLGPWILVVPVALVVLTQLNDQLDTGDTFNSAYQRLDWYGETIEIWQTSPIFGVGLRWWYTGQFGSFQPPNAELEVLSSTGIVGLAGFLAMFAIATVALWRLDPRYGTAAVAIVATRFTQAQFDLYWVAGQSSLLWIFAGLAFGAVAHHRAQASADHAVGSAVPALRAR